MNPMVFSGRSHPAMGRRLAEVLELEPGRCRIDDFADGEIRVEIKQDVANRDVFIVQSTAGMAGKHLLELLLLADAARRRGARQIIAVIPYFGYARQDRRISGEEPIAARVVTDLLAVRFDRVVTVDLHNPSLEGFSSVPLMHLSAVPLLAEAFREYRRPENVLVAPDAGAVELAQRYGKMLNLPMAYIEKVRKSDREVEIQSVAGDVKGRVPVIIDDMISTGGTMAAAIEALLEEGAEPEVSILASHCLLTGEAVPILEPLPIRRIITTDSVPGHGSGGLLLEKYSLAQILADHVRSQIRH
jgi:ribose-phosphate pyrophosphokinase